MHWTGKEWLDEGIAPLRRSEQDSPSVWCRLRASSTEAEVSQTSLRFGSLSQAVCVASHTQEHMCEDRNIHWAPTGMAADKRGCATVSCQDLLLLHPTIPPFLRHALSCSLCVYIRLHVQVHASRATHCLLCTLYITSILLIIFPKLLIPFPPKSPIFSHSLIHHLNSVSSCFSFPLPLFLWTRHLAV